ncbi:MAG: iron-containing alcohol dehydrogenase family protein [Promethearchaeota archaeon]
MIKKYIKMSRVYLNPEIYYGKGAVSCLKAIPQNNLLLLLSNTIKNSEYYKTIQSYIENKLYKEEIIPRPTSEIVLSLREKYINDKPEVIIAIGGGKVIDTAKCVRFLLNNPSVQLSEMHEIQFSNNNDIKFVAVPTTPSTGSEANAASVITFPNGAKVPYINDGFVPDMAVLDFTFLESLDVRALYILAADIFTHAIEGMTSIARTPFLKALGTTCLSLLESGFQKLKKNPKDLKALADISCAGYTGGVVLGNAYVGACHALAHTLEKQLKGSHSNHILSVLKLIMLWSKKQSNNPIYDDFLRIYDSIGFDHYVNYDIFDKVDVAQWIKDAIKDPNMLFNGIKMGIEPTKDLINFIMNNKKVIQPIQ